MYVSETGTVTDANRPINAQLRAMLMCCVNWHRNPGTTVVGVTPFHELPASLHSGSIQHPTSDPDRSDVGSVPLTYLQAVGNLPMVALPSHRAPHRALAGV